MLPYYNFFEYWTLYHKVTFDGINKLILVNEGITSLNWAVDVYSAWKEWMEVSSHLGNAGFLPAIRVVGGDFITADGARRVGSTYFLTNGWRIRTWAGNHRLSINGNVFTEEGDPIYVPTEGPYSIVIEQTVSTLVESQINTIETEIPAAGPTTQEIVDAVWNRLAISNASSGSFGEYVNMIKATSESTANSMVTVQSKLDTANDLIATLLKYEKNRTQINQTAKTMTVYDDDGVTVLRVFDLKDFAGQPSITQVAERVPQ